MTLSRHPGPGSRSRAVVVRLDPRCDSSFRSTRSPTFDRRRSPRPRPPFARPWPHFLVRVCRVYLGPDVAYRLLQLLRRTGTQPGALTILAGTGTVMPFLFFVDLPRPLPCGSGDKRRAAQRSFAPTPVPVPPGFRQVCPTAIPIRTRHLRELPRRST